MMRLRFILPLALFCVCCEALHYRSDGASEARRAAKHSRFPDLDTATISDLLNGMSRGHFTSEDLVKAYIKRIEETQDSLRSVLEVNHYALAEAHDIDARRLEGENLPVLAGVPILLKDTIGTARTEPYSMSTSGGSYALLGSSLQEDSTVAAKLRAAGAILLGKTNLSQCLFRLHLCGWAKNPPNGWSVRGGQTSGAYYENQDPGGSSSGSAVAVAVGLAPVSIATETDGSIISPARRAALCGIKPTRGLVSRWGTIPVSETQDTVGPMAQTCRDAALVLGVIAGKDEKDPHTEDIPFDTIPHYTAACTEDGLKGARLGIPASYFDNWHAPPEFKAFAPYEMAAFYDAIPLLEKLGASVQHDADFPETDRMHQRDKNESLVLFTEQHAAFSVYLAELTSNPHELETIEDLLKWSETSEEWPQGVVRTSLAKAINLDHDHVHDHEADEYKEALESNLYLGSHGSILGALDKYDLDALIMPSTLSSGPAALAGYPIVTVPSGWTPEDVAVRYNAAHTLVDRGPNLPIGISFVGRRFSEEKLIAYACAFEQLTRYRDKVDPWVLPETQLEDVVQRHVGRASDEL